MAADAEAEVSRQIVEGSRRIPQTDEELRWAEWDVRRTIEEPKALLTEKITPLSAAQMREVCAPLSRATGC